MHMQYYIQGLNNPLIRSVLIFLVLIALLKIIRVQKKKLRSGQLPSTKLNQDIHAIAGEDVFATQLDLARAYIEMGKKQLAKTVLEQIRKQGNPSQQQQAMELISSL